MEKFAPPALAMLVGCAGPGTPPAPATTIAVDLSSNPAMLAVREGVDATAPWREIAIGTQPTTFTVTDQVYAVALDCPTGPAIPDAAPTHQTTAISMRTLDDAREFPLRCPVAPGDGDGDDPALPVTHATGVMADAGDVLVGTTDFHIDGTDAPLDWTIPKSTTRILALTSARFLDRAIDASNDTTDLGTIDVANDGSDRIAETFALGDLSAATDLAVTAELAYADIDASVTSALAPTASPIALAMMPPAILDGGTQTWTIAANTGATASRGVRFSWHPPTPSAFALLDPIAAPAFAASAVSWDALPADLDLISFETSDATATNLVTMTGRALAAAGAASLDASPAGLPRFDASWAATGATATRVLWGDRFLDQDDTLFVIATAP